MKGMVKVWLGLVAGALFLMPAVTAQTPPMLVKAVRKDAFEKSSRYRYTPNGEYYYETGLDTTRYEITVINAGREDLKDVKVTWALLIKTLEPVDPMRIVEGERVCSLKPGQKFTFETDVIEVNSVRSSGFPTRLTRAEIQGCVVEAIVNDRVAGSSIQPLNTKQRIDQIKAAKKQAQPGETPPQRHTF